MLSGATWSGSTSWSGAAAGPSTSWWSTSPTRPSSTLLVSEISQVDGVDVEDVRRAADGLGDPRLDALETASSLVNQNEVVPLLHTLTRSSIRDFQSDWAAVVDPESSSTWSRSGPCPPWPG